MFEKEEGRRKREDGRRKTEDGRRKRENTETGVLGTNTNFTNRDKRQV